MENMAGLKAQVDRGQETQEEQAILRREYDNLYEDAAAKDKVITDLH